ncbi:dihydrofolate reductase [Candidatus Parcubacteria bacterium]|nr:dihydrofolate reductase [Candidatus Parcubacteria bacterium]
MQKPKISIIAGIQKKDRGIGKDNQLLWKISDDLKRFKALTSGHVIISGRKNFESIGRPLPNRTNIIITRNPEYKAEGCIIVVSLEEALAKAKELEKEEIFIMGGGEIYKQALPFTDKLYLTIIDGEKPADIFFPDYSEFTKEIFREEYLDNDPPYIFLELEK